MFLEQRLFTQRSGDCGGSSDRAGIIICLKLWKGSNQEVSFLIGWKSYQGWRDILATSGLLGCEIACNCCVSNFMERASWAVRGRGRESLPFWVESPETCSWKSLRVGLAFLEGPWAEGVRPGQSWRKHRGLCLHWVWVFIESVSARPECPGINHWGNESGLGRGGGVWDGDGPDRDCRSWLSTAYHICHFRVATEHWAKAEGT